MISKSVSTADEMRTLAAEFAKSLLAGDVVILSGPLGAGKTTFTQGLAAGLGVRGPITSPTFVISRIHPSLSNGPSLIHVDAYRVNSLSEIDDLDLDSDLEQAVLVAEWGEGKIDALVSPTYVVEISRSEGEDEIRHIKISSASDVSQPS
jgi:tRNA threonylcarbamoyladenosine biosynthesis protein TsaE